MFSLCFKSLLWGSQGCSAFCLVFGYAGAGPKWEDEVKKKRQWQQPGKGRPRVQVAFGKVKAVQRPVALILGETLVSDLCQHHLIDIWFYPPKRRDTKSPGKMEHPKHCFGVCWGPLADGRTISMKVVLGHSGNHWSFCRGSFMEVEGKRHKLVVDALQEQG